MACAYPKNMNVSLLTHHLHDWLRRTQHSLSTRQPEICLAKSNESLVKLGYKWLWGDRLFCYRWTPLNRLLAKSLDLDMKPQINADKRKDENHSLLTPDSYFLDRHHEHEYTTLKLKALSSHRAFCTPRSALSS